MAILVEFYGIPRIRAGVNQISVLEGRDRASLGEVLREVATKLPDFAESCLNKNQLKETFIASIDGEHFASNDETTVLKDQSVLLLSTDAGG
jgi:hypothetical protein